MNIRLPQIRIEIPSIVKDMERLSRQIGLSQQLEAEAEEKAAQEIAKGSLLAWQLKSISRIALRAAAIKGESR